jgi:hypothetical protein
LKDKVFRAYYCSGCKKLMGFLFDISAIIWLEVPIAHGSKHHSLTCNIQRTETIKPITYRGHKVQDELE